MHPKRLICRLERGTSERSPNCQRPPFRVHILLVVAKTGGNGRLFVPSVTVRAQNEPYSAQLAAPLGTGEITGRETAEEPRWVGGLWRCSPATEAPCQDRR
jgi:hypothetical protein